MLKVLKIMLFSFLMSLCSIGVYQLTASILKKYDVYSYGLSAAIVLLVYVLFIVALRKHQTVVYALVGSMVLSFVLWPMLFYVLDSTPTFTF